MRDVNARHTNRQQMDGINGWKVHKDLNTCLNAHIYTYILGVIGWISRIIINLNYDWEYESVSN